MDAKQPEPHSTETQPESQPDPTHPNLSKYRERIGTDGLITCVADTMRRVETLEAMVRVLTESDLESKAKLERMEQHLARLEQQRGRGGK